jgi:predicted dehydrogenase
MIAGVIAEAIARSSTARVSAVSSRQIESARAFVANRTGAVPVQGIDSLLARADVDAVYIATPTVAKEEIGLASIAAGKHVLIDKPFADRASVERITRAAADRGVAFMDATHFVHHPRTAAIQALSAEKIGAPRSLYTSFYFPQVDRTNIRVNRDLEPMTALGDMGWYSMRAMVEFLRPTGHITKVATVAERDPESAAILRASGMIAFEGGEVSTFDVGYTAGTVLMDLALLGTRGVIGMDDFVLDWTESFAFRNREVPTGFTFRTGMATRQDVEFIPAPTKTAQEVQMIENFVALATAGTAAARARYAAATLKTQEYVDAIWKAANS